MMRKRIGQQRKLRRLLKKSLSALLAGICALTAVGCGGGGLGEAGRPETETAGEAGAAGDAGAKGRYMEEQLNTPEELKYLSDMARFGESGLALIDAMNGEVYISQEQGDSWERLEIAALSELSAQETEITGMAVDREGGVFCSYIPWGEASGFGENEELRWQEHYVYARPDGETRELSFALEGSYGSLQRAVFADDGSLYVMDSGGAVYAADIESSTLTRLFAFDQTVYMDICASGDYLIGVHDDGVILYQRSSGKQTGEDTVLNEFVAEELKDKEASIALCVDEKGTSVYSASGSGLYGHVSGGGVMEELLSGGLSALGDPTKEPAALLANADDSFYIAYRDGEVDRLTYDASAPTTPSRQLTVYSLNENDTLSKAISSFRKSHPDVYVKAEIGYTGENGITKEDAVMNLNTRLLAGEGPDLMLLDGLPMESYIEKGILAELGGLMDGLKEKGNYFTNILESYQGDEGLYAVPIRFLVPLLVGDAAAVEQAADLQSFADAVERERSEHPGTETILGVYTAEELLSVLAVSSAGAWMQNGEIDEAALREFLTQANRIYQAERQNITEDILQSHKELRAHQEDLGLYEKANRLSLNSLLDILLGNQTMSVGNACGMDSFQSVCALLENDGNMSYRAFNGQTQQAFCPVGLAGINQKTNDREAAEEFFAELLSENVQQSDLEDGFPVNADAFDHSFTKNPNPNQSYSLATSDSEGNMVDVTLQWPTEEQVAALRELILGLASPVEQETALYEAALADGQRVLEGELTVEEGVDEIKKKMELVFAE